MSFQIKSFAVSNAAGIVEKRVSVTEHGELVTFLMVYLY